MKDFVAFLGSLTNIHFFIQILKNHCFWLMLGCKNVRMSSVVTIDFLNIDILDQ